MGTRKAQVIRRSVIAIVIVAAAVGLFLGGKSLRDEYYPVHVDPSPEWEPYVSSLQVERDPFFVEADDGVKLEAELFIPNGGAAAKAAVVFIPGSGDSLYQNYAWGFIETYILNVFLSRDMAVLLVNKRGMGLSEGDYTRGSIQTRADDLWSSVESIQSHPRIDFSRVGVIGHSEGGWVVTQSAADHQEIAFVITLAGPATTRFEQAVDMYTHEAICAGLQGAERESYLERRIRITNLGSKIGEWTNFGLLGFDARTMQYDPRGALRSTESPGLMIFSENDNLVTSSLNIDRLNEIFDGTISDRIDVSVIDGATHVFRIVENPCGSLEDPTTKEQSTQLVDVLHTWLSRQGY